MIDFSLRPDLTSMPVNNPSHRRQPDPRAFKILQGMKTLKRFKEFIDVSHIEPHTIITNIVHGSSILPECSNLDSGVYFFAGKLPRVSQQVLHNDLHHRFVRLDVHIGSDDKFDDAFHFHFYEIVGDGSGHLAQIDFFAIHITSGHVRQTQ